LVAPEGVEQVELTEPWEAVNGPWTLVEADVVRGRTITWWPSVQTDIRNAGGNWGDEEVVADERRGNTLISSRKPDDLPAFCAKLLEAFSQ
jgi:protease I